MNFLSFLFRSHPPFCTFSTEHLFKGDATFLWSPTPWLCSNPPGQGTPYGAGWRIVPSVFWVFDLVNTPQQGLVLSLSETSVRGLPRNVPKCLLRLISTPFESPKAFFFCHSTSPAAEPFTLNITIFANRPCSRYLPTLCITHFPFQRNQHSHFSSNLQEFRPFLTPPC